MNFKTFCFVVIASLLGAGAYAQSHSMQIHFIVPVGTPVVQSGNEFGVVLGKPLDAVSGPLLDCAGEGTFPVHNVLFVRPLLGSLFVTVMVTAPQEALEPGSRLEEISAITSCVASDGMLYDKYAAYVRIDD